MSDIFKSFSELPPEIGWGIFITIFALMALVPYLGTIGRFLKVIFKNEKAEILDFSWRIAKDHFLTRFKGKSYYLSAQGKNFVIEGGKIILNWNVKGAYRIDLLPIGQKMKGNTAFVIARKDNCDYVLIAHTLKGKLTKTLSIAPENFRQIQTFNISKEDTFKQKKFKNVKTDINTKHIVIGRYKNSKEKNYKKTFANSFLTDLKRIYVSKKTPVLNYDYKRMLIKPRKNYYFQKPKFTTFAFHPKRYNKALNDN